MQAIAADVPAQSVTKNHCRKKNNALLHKLSAGNERQARDEKNAGFERLAGEQGQHLHGRGHNTVLQQRLLVSDLTGLHETDDKR